jgi:hypothetical protein
MWQKLILLLLVVGIIMAAVILYGRFQWQARTKNLYTKIHAARSPTDSATYDQRELEGLPAPVRRYFQKVLPDGQPLIAAVNVVHRGTFNISESSEQWQPFTSTQHVNTRRPGFVWDARIQMAPALTVFVQDAYVAGEGILTAKLLGLLTVMEQPNTPELAQGELMRFFAEAAWYPTALLPSHTLAWQAVDESQASATFIDGTTTVRLLVQFDEQGLISSVRSENRYRAVDGVPVATPWQGQFWNYEEHEGILIPVEGEVAWLLPEGAKPYWRGRIEHIVYEFMG